MLRRECRVFGFELRGGEEFCDESFGVGVRAIVGEAIEFIQLRGKAQFIPSPWVPSIHVQFADLEVVRPTFTK